MHFAYGELFLSFNQREHFPMSLSINTKTYSADSFSTNQIGYAGPNQTSSVKDKFVLGRTTAKPTATFSGVVRSDGKLTRTLTLTGALTPSADAIAEFKTSIPVGAASADIDAILNDLGAFIASATYKDIVKKSMVNF
jgi:hypothetical protein